MNVTDRTAIPDTNPASGRIPALSPAEQLTALRDLVDARIADAESRLRWAYGLLALRREPVTGSAAGDEERRRKSAVDLAEWIGRTAREMAEREG